MGKSPTLDRVSAGGVAYREVGGRIEVALIQTTMSGKDRWQLPKGIVETGEEAEIAALREVKEETNISAESLGLIETIEYWYYATRGGQRVRYHKFVHFYLMQATTDDIRGQAGETNEARWVEIDEAVGMLAFDNENEAVRKAKAMIEERRA